MTASKLRIRSPEFATRWLLGPKQHAEIIDLLEPHRKDIQHLCRKYTKRKRNAIEAASCSLPPMVQSPKTAEELRKANIRSRAVRDVVSPIRAEWARELTQVLTPKQLTKFNEWQLQNMRESPLFVPEIQRLLGLTSHQVETLAAIRRKSITVSRADLGQLGPLELAALRQEKAKREALAVLTNEQSAGYQLLLGKPVAE